MVLRRDDKVNMGKYLLCHIWELLAYSKEVLSLRGVMCTDDCDSRAMGVREKWDGGTTKVTGTCLSVPVR